jgi:hypothetical protein
MGDECWPYCSLKRKYSRAASGDVGSQVTCCNSVHGRRESKAEVVLLVKPYTLFYVVVCWGGIQRIG